MLLRKLANSDLESAPDEPWVANVATTVNALVDHAAAPTPAQHVDLLTQSNVELIEIDVQVPDPWFTVGTGNAPAFQNSWTGTAQFVKSYDGMVEVVLLVSAGTAATVFTLGNGFIPKAIVPFCLFNGFTGAVLQGQIRTDGTVQLFPGGASPFPLLTGTVTFLSSDVTPIPMSCFPVVAKTGLKSVAGMVVLGVQDAGTAASQAQGTAGSAGSVDFTTAASPKGLQIKIRNIMGLPYNRKSHVKLLAIGGS